MEPTQWVHVGTIVVSFLLFILPFRLRRTIIEPEKSGRLWPWTMAKLANHAQVEALAKKKFVLVNGGFEFPSQKTDKGEFILSESFIGEIRLKEGHAVKLNVLGKERPAVMIMSLDKISEQMIQAASLALFLHAVIRLFM